MEKKCDINLADEVNGNSPLMLATSLNMVSCRSLSLCQTDIICLQVNIVKTLIKEGADVNLADWNSKTPLHCAAAAGEEKIFLSLV